MHAALEQLYDNNAVQYQLSDDTKFDDDFFDKVADEIFQMGGYSPEYLTTPNGSALIEETSRIFDNAINAGIGYEPDPELQSALSQNAFVFSGFKTDKELQEVAAMLKDENGDIVPFDEFKRKVLGINAKYNVNYLQAEYNFAVQSAQMASKWQEFEKHKDFVNLQYRTAGDERVREEHRALDKTTLPVDDPFWKEYLPPLGWNCRCTVVEVLKDLQPVSNSAQAIKAGQMATSKPAQKIFRFNPGQTQKLFPPKHPYLPKGNECKNCNKNLLNLLQSDKNPLCKTCVSIGICLKQKQSQDSFKFPSKEWIKNTLDFAKNNHKSCNRGIKIGNVENSIIDFLKTKKIECKESQRIITDGQIIHATRDVKKGAKKALPNEHLINIEYYLNNAEVYYDKGDLLYIYKNGDIYYKFVFTPNYKKRINEQIQEGFFFITAGIILKIESGWIKI